VRLAVLDLGSNSFHLAVFRAGRVRPERLARHRAMVRLGDEIGADGRLTAAGWQRGERALAELVGLARGAADRVLAVATSALREARDGAEFCAAARRRHGVAIDVLSGDDEARLCYLGAALGAGERADQGLIELGGGSAQLAVGRGPTVHALASLPIGVLRLRSLDDAELRARVRAAAGDAIARLRVNPPAIWLLGGGTARRLGRLARALGLASPIGRPALTRARLLALAEAIGRLTPAELSARGVEPARHDTVRPGALALATLLEVVGVESALIAPGGLREGLAHRELALAPGRLGVAASG
jgi:exopolyphosphatase/guanosine-5'-triphosphate,3'-diphosphate pyrophosphatase